MNVVQYLRYLHLAYRSQPAEERAVYRLIKRQRPRTIVELGIGTGQRTVRMLDLARRVAEEEGVRYTGCDLFEGRPDGTPGLSLKEAHRTLARQDVQVRLAPGDVLSVLARMANSLTGTDLLIISGAHDPQMLAAAWFYVPRMLHADSIVLQQVAGAEPQTTCFERLSAVELQRRAAASRPARAA